MSPDDKSADNGRPPIRGEIVPVEAREASVMPDDPEAAEASTDAGQVPKDAVTYFHKVATAQRSGPATATVIASPASDREEAAAGAATPLPTQGGPGGAKAPLPAPPGPRSGPAPAARFVPATQSADPGTTGPASPDAESRSASPAARLAGSAPAPEPGTRRPAPESSAAASARPVPEPATRQPSAPAAESAAGAAAMGRSASPGAGSGTARPAGPASGPSAGSGTPRPAGPASGPGTAPPAATPPGPAKPALVTAPPVTAAPAPAQANGGGEPAPGRPPAQANGGGRPAQERPARGDLLGDISGLRDKWPEIQRNFVDDPRAAVVRAADLTGELAERLRKAIKQREQELRGGWDGQPHPDTENLRKALLLYREFLHNMIGTPS